MQKRALAFCVCSRKIYVCAHLCAFAALFLLLFVIFVRHVNQISRVYRITREICRKNIDLLRGDEERESVLRSVL